MARVRGDAVWHCYLILKHRKGKVGIWDLKQDAWHIPPWTNDLGKAFSMLQTARAVLSRRAA